MGKLKRGPKGDRSYEGEKLSNRINDRLTQMYGNLDAVFAGSRKLKPKQRVKVMTDTVMLDAVATGRKEKELHILLWSNSHGRKFVMRCKKDCILVKW